MVSASKFPVAFTFFTDGKEWHGGRNYFRSLFLALQSLPASKVQPIAFVGKRVDVSGFEFPANVQVVQDSAFDIYSIKWNLNRLLTKIFGVSWLVNRIIRRYGIRVVSHGFSGGDPILKCIGWIPDFQHVYLPHFFKDKELKSRNLTYQGLMKKCDLVIVSSESAREDLRKFAPDFFYKTRVLRFCAVRPDVDVASAGDVQIKYHLNGIYFYIPNQAWAHKNHIVAIRAFAQLMNDYPEVKVVCSGGLNDYRNPNYLNLLRSEIEYFGLADRFILLGVVPYAHIAQLMLQAVAVINPSLFEGWSTTVEEAKALGVPLILSDINVHREQCQNGEAIFFDPKNPQSLANQMRVMLLNSEERSPVLQLKKALERHHLCSEEFARNYEKIVAELYEYS